MSFWRKEDPVLGDPMPGTGVRPVLVGGMFEHQRQWWELKNFIRILVGGYGSGKTRSLAKWGISTALHNAPAWTALVSPNFPLARRTLIPTIEELLEGKCKLRKDMKFSHNKGDHSFDIQVQCRPLARLFYLSGDIPDNLKGPNLGCAGIDEPFIQDRSVFDQMVARCRDPRARLHAVAATGTPEELNWGFDICEGEDKDKYDVGLVTADTRLNLALPAMYANRLLSMYDPKAAQAYVEGKFVSMSTGRVFHSFDRNDNVCVKDSNGAVWFAGMDFNVNPMAFCVGWHRKEEIHIVKEWEIPNSDTQEACSFIKSEFPQVRICFPDPSGKARHTNAPAGVSDFTWIGRAGMIVLAPNEAWARRDSFNSVNAKLSRREMTIDPSCKRLIRYMTEHSYERRKKQESMTHLLDAVRYPVTYLFPITRPSSLSVAISA